VEEKSKSHGATEALSLKELKEIERGKLVIDLIQWRLGLLGRTR
jgi:hypothetical protein